MQLMGLQVSRIEAGRIECVLDVQQAHLQHKGFVHGGVIATLADVVAGFAAVSLVPKDYHVVTVELKVSYLHPATETRLRAVGWVLKPGRKLHFCEAEVYAEGTDEPLLVAKATTTMAVLTPEDVKR